MTNWRDVYGNCSIKLQLALNNDYPVPTYFETIFEEIIGNVSNKYLEFKVYVNQIAIFFIIEVWLCLSLKFFHLHAVRSVLLVIILI